MSVREGRGGRESLSHVKEQLSVRTLPGATSAGRATSPVSEAAGGRGQRTVSTANKASRWTTGSAKVGVKNSSRAPIARVQIPLILTMRQKNPHMTFIMYYKVVRLILIKNFM